MSILVGYPLSEDLVGGGREAGVVSQYQHVAFMQNVWVHTHGQGCIPLSERSRKRMVSRSKVPPSLFNPSSETGEEGRRRRS